MSANWMLKPLINLNGSAKQRTLLVCAHANGFCKEMWVPVLDDLKQALEKHKVIEGKVDALCVDLPGHGESEPFEIPLSIEKLGYGVLDALDSFLDGTKSHRESDYDCFVGVGHSIGGISILEAQLARPNLFRSMLLIEPILLPPNADGEFVRADKNPLRLFTLKRKNHFESREAAFQNWKGKGAYMQWRDNILKTFCEHGLRASKDGGFELKCKRELEAEIYATKISTRGRLDEVECPITLLNTTKDGHVSAELAVENARLMKNLRALILLASGTHFMPMEIPEVIAAHIENHLVQDVEAAQTIPRL